MRPTRSLAPLLALALTLPVGALAVSAPAASALPDAVVVDTWTDELNADGDCSLREAVATVNTAIAIDACVLAAHPTIEVGAGAFWLDAPLAFTTSATVRGAGPVTTTIDCGAVVGDCIDSTGVGADLVLRHLSVSTSSAALVHAGPFAGALRFDDVIAWSGATGFVNEGGPIEMSNGSSLWGNQSVGLRTGSGTITVHDSVIGGNGTDAIETESGVVYVGHSTIYDNDGYAIDTGSSNVFVFDSTITDNGLDAARTHDGNLSFESTTLVGNRRAFSSTGGGVARFTNSLVAQQDLGNCASAPISLGFNVADDDTCSFGQATDRNGIDPGIGALDVMTTHPTYPLLDGSPLIDTGGDCLADDQLHQTRPADGDGDGVAACDVGAIEHPAVPLQPADPTDPEVDEPDDAAEPAAPPSARPATPVSARPAFTG